MGATKGLGLGFAARYLAEGWRVIATTVEPSPGLADLRARRLDRLEVHDLDITDVPAVEVLRARLAHRRLDVVHQVAGVFQVSFAPIWEQAPEEVLRLLNTNAIAAVRIAEIFAPLVPRGGAFAFTSSGMGSLARNDKGDVDLYRISKVSLNMLVRSFAARHAGEGRAVLLLCPGWAKTDMGGPQATVEIGDSVAGMYRLVIEADAKRPEAVFHEYTGREVAW